MGVKIMLKTGIKTSEFYMAVAGIILGIVKKYVLPDLSQEAFYTIIAYIIARAVTKHSS